MSNINKESPLFLSVIIPVYNAEQYLIECLDSVFGLDKYSIDFEVICVDDNSTDNSPNILKNYSLKRANMQVIYQSINGGASVARNLGLEIAKGEYIWFVDSDDIVILDDVNDVKKAVDDNYPDFVTFAAIKGENLETAKTLAYNSRIEKKYTLHELFVELSKEKDWRRTPWRHWIKRDFIKNNQLSFYEGIVNEDILFSFKLYMCNGIAIELPYNMYFYRVRVGSVEHTENKNRFRSLIIILNEIYAYWREHSFLKEEHKAIEMFLTSVYSLIYRMEKSQLFFSADKALYSLIIEDFNPYFEIEESEIKMLRNEASVVIYGAGDVAKSLFRMLKNKGINVKGFAVSNIECNPIEVSDLPVKVIDDWKQDNVLIVNGILRADKNDMDERVQKLGMREIVYFKVK